MARPGITKQQVFDTASALRDEGILPTVSAVRERLGTGSFSTVGNHLSAWKAEVANQEVAEIPDIPDAVQSVFQQVWAAAAKAAQKDVETQRQAMEAMRRELEKEKSEMTKEIQRLEQNLDSAAEKTKLAEDNLNTVQQSMQEKDSQLTELRIDNARLDERVKGAEGRVVEMKEQIEALQTTLTQQATPQSSTTQKKKSP